MTREQFISRVETSQRALRRFLAALCCGDVQLADDLAQETYVKAWLACGAVGVCENFNAWLRRIAYNTFLNSRRAHRPTVGYDEAPELSGGAEADDAFRYQELYAALDRLPGKERTSVLLYYMEGYSVKEVADITGASPEAVRQHLSRGRSHLRGLLIPSES